MSLIRALQVARDRGLDLVEVSPTAVPPVCRLLDYGKYKYEQTKREREARKNQRISLLKEIRLRPKTDDHDLDNKARQAQKFLEEGDKVKVTVMFRGREMSHPHLGRELLDRMLESLRGMAGIEQGVVMEGRNLSLILAPLAGHGRKETKQEEGA